MAALDPGDELVLGVAGSGAVTQGSTREIGELGCAPEPLEAPAGCEVRRGGCQP
jgi:hypothetical protein